MRSLRWLPVLIWCTSTLSAGEAAAQFEPSASSYLGGSGDDEVLGVAVRADGTLLVAARASALPMGVTPGTLGNASASSPGVLLILSPDGRSVQAAARVASEVQDLALDGSDRIWLAAGPDGLLAIEADLSAVRWTATPGHVHRVDVTADGVAAALVPSNPGNADTAGGAGNIHVYDAAGAQTASFEGYRNTLDVAIDAASQTIVTIGWRQANATDPSGNTNPVQIAYLRGTALDGTTRWTDYDWSTDSSSDRFINAPTNNMADTRGYRVSVGRDGRLYAAFECAGGNHIFRYSPTDINTRVDIVGGDNYHNFSNTRSEHKTFFGIYNPASGEYLTGQQLVARRNDGDGNTCRVERGEITADEAGRVYVVGSASAHLPLTWWPGGTGDYGGGAYLVVLSADLRQRLFVTRLTPSGGNHAVDARTIDGTTRIVLGGTANDDQLYTLNAIQGTTGGGEDGLIGVLGAPGAAPLPDAGPPAPRDAGPPRDGGPRGMGNDGGVEGTSTAGGCGCRVGAGGRGATYVGLALAALLIARATRKRSARAKP